MEGVFRRLKGLHRISEKNIEEGIREIRLALLEADVNYKVVKDFVASIREKTLGEEVHKKVSPVEQFYKIVYDELVNFLGGEEPKLDLKAGDTSVVMLCGLQGSGKTTSAAKLGLFLKAQSSVLLVGADVYRPAARDQLRILAEKENFAFYTEDHLDAVKICKNAVKYAKKNLHNVVILDTAGRLHLDEDLMKELEEVKKAVQPDEILLVADAMAGQSVVDVAVAFNERLDLSGVVLTKFDSDAKGGAALSIKETTGKPIKFIGVGEKLKDLEIFHPDRIASRLLGRGDILSLVEKTQQVIEEDDAERLAKKMMKGKLDLQDFLTQLRMMRKIGNLESIMGMLPLPGQLKNMDTSAAENELKKMEAMILSMTPRERENFRIIESSRKRRITKGSGTTMRDITRFLDQFQKMGKMVKKFSKKAKMLEKFLPKGGAGMEIPDIPGMQDMKNLNIKNFKI
jgi:signal recognition particle subunit SRP54